MFFSVSTSRAVGGVDLAAIVLLGADLASTSAIVAVETEPVSPVVEETMMTKCQNLQEAVRKPQEKTRANF